MRYAQQHGVLCAHAELGNRHFQRRFTQAALSLGAAKRWIAAGKTGGSPLPTLRGTVLAVSRCCNPSVSLSLDTSPKNSSNFQGRQEALISGEAWRHLFQGRLNIVRLPKGSGEVFGQRKDAGCLCNSRPCLKGGNYLSSRVVRPSTLGVRELNFCVRNGNRWILSAIVTAMVY